MRDHPCHACPDRESHARWAERYHKLERDTKNQRSRHRAAHQHRGPPVRPRVRGARRAGLPRRRRGHRGRQEAAACLQRARPARQRVHTRRRVGRPRRRRAGRRDQRSDLRVTQCRRRSGTAFPDPQGARRRRCDELALGAELEQLEREHRVKFLHQPDFGFAQAVWQWSMGASLDDVLPTWSWPPATSYVP